MTKCCLIINQAFDAFIPLSEFKAFKRILERSEVSKLLIVSYYKVRKPSETIVKFFSDLKIPYELKNLYDLEKLEEQSDDIVKEFDTFYSFIPEGNFLGGHINIKSVMFHVLASKATSANKKLFIRFPDSEIPYYDLPTMTESRPSDFWISQEKTKELFGKYKINYDHVIFVANSSKLVYDWVPNTFKRYSRNIPKDLSINYTYAGDLLFFEEHSKMTPKEIDLDFGIFYVGFLSSRMSKRRKVLLDLLSEFELNVKCHFIGAGSEWFEDKIQSDRFSYSTSNILGDDYYSYLNSKIAMINVCKGDKVIPYINKSLYDQAFAGTVSLILEKTDSTKILYDGDERFRFHNLEDLQKKLLFLKENPKDRLQWIEDQRKWIFSRDEDCKFSLT